MKLIIHSNLIIIAPDSDIEAKCVQDLTFPNPKYYMNKRLGLFRNPESPQIIMFIKQGNCLILPRGYDIRQWMHRFSEIENHMIEPVATRLEFDTTNLTPFSFQSAAASEFIKVGQGGVIAPCGSGKTELAIVVLSILKIPTLILVPKIDLVKQWADRIQDRLKYKVGTIVGGKHRPGDVTVATVQSLYSKNGLIKYGPEFYNKFSMVILDEAHRSPAKSWMVVLAKCAARYRLWLTATPNRKDGLGPTIPLSCGKIIYSIEHTELIKSGRIMAPKYIEHKLPFLSGSFTKKATVDGKSVDVTDRLLLDRSIFTHPQRNLFIVDQVVKDYAANKVILILTPKSVEHAKLLCSMLVSRGVTAKLLIGEIVQDERKKIFDDIKSGALRCIVATTVAEEGLDLPILNSLHLAYPYTDAEQAIGRVMRTCAGKTETEVVDYVDHLVPYLLDRAHKRQKFFKKLV